MQILVKTRPNSRQESIELLTQSSLDFGSKDVNMEVYKVCVKEPARNGLANKAIIKVLSKYFKVSSLQITLQSGHSSKQKVFEIGK